MLATDMGIGLFAMHLVLHGAPLIGGMMQGTAVWPIPKDLGLPLRRLLEAAYMPKISAAPPRALGHRPD